jgi:phosphatidylserine synthase
MGLAWIPNVFTLGNLFFGFSAMLAALRGRFDLAAIFVFVSMLLDMFDGRIARAIRTESAIGKELDSFADMVSFGIVPGVVFYAAFLGNNPIYSDLAPFIEQKVFLQEFTDYTWTHLLFGALAFLFPLAAVIRLARFNVAEASDTFSGCPAPAAGGLVVFVTGFSQISSFELIPDWLHQIQLPSLALIIFFVMMALFMVVKIPFSKPQAAFLSPKMLKRPSMMLVNIVIIAVTVLFFKHVLVLVGMGYVLWSLGSGFFCTPRKS